MNGIERFNNQINKRKYFSNSISKEYTDQIEMLLKSAFSRLEKREKIVIIGAGNLSDFSVEFLLKYFETVVLTDVDVEAINDGLRYMRLPQKYNSRIDVRRIEYTGFENAEFFVDFKERIINCYTEEKINKVIMSKLKSISTYKFLKDDEDIDFIYVSPIYTQLIYHQLLAECKVLEDNGYPKHLVKYIRELMLDQMTYVIERFNKNLVNKLSNEGALFVLSDIFQLEIKSGFYRRVANSIKNYSVMEELYDGYKEKYGMGLGDYGLYNLGFLARSTLSRWLIWPYDEVSSFIVKLEIYSK
jgi:hypothetical protein